MKGKRCITYTAAALVLALMWSFGIGYALTDQEKLDQVNNQKSTVQKQLNEGKKKVNALNEEIKSLEKQINAAESEVGTLQGQIDKTKNDITAKLANLEKVKAEMEVQNTNMNNRLRAMYKNGDVGMLEILLGSESISDFLSNADMAQKIMDNDAEMLEQMQVQYEAIEKQKKELESMQAKLVAQQDEIEAKQKSLEASQNQVNVKKEEVVKDNKALEAQINDFNREAAALAASIRALQDNNAVYSGGALGWPCQGRISSEFGYRIHPILKTKKLHTGLDIAVPTGTTIRAAADGKVIKAGWNNSYGNMVMIDHGSGIVTVYAHNSKLNVSTGQTVTRGQQIAAAGSTGQSTGPHCHFEVRLNGEYQNPRNYL